MATMHYVEVLVADATYHGREALTYSSPTKLVKGSVVLVPLRTKQVLGIVSGHASRPAFHTKSINSTAGIPVMPPQSLALLLWMKDHYPAPLGVIVQLFLPKNLPKNHPEPSPSLVAPSDHPKLPPLTPDQQKVLHELRGPGLHIVHGDTGSGKTRVYIELTKRAFSQNKSAIILTPEISLTPQLTHNFRQVFGDDNVITVHSQLTETTRRNLWINTLSRTRPVVIIGPRSTLFSPLKSVGLIVIDEAHENAYKQDQAPHYHASMVAAKLASLHGASLVLGSATPQVSDYYFAKQKGRPVLRMTQTATGGVKEASRKSVNIVDLRDKSMFSRSPWLSNGLITAIGETIDQGGQALLFLNRRGTARVVFCSSCGWQALCPHCDIPLIYHGDLHTMRCHTCNYTTKSPASCPDCRNPSVVFKTVGTKAIVEEVKSIFPSARIRRFDTDNSKAERIEQHYQAVRNGEVDIIIGTQLLAKGLDLPKLGVVGVLVADTSLTFPDFSSQERTYQLLVQVLGRVGRGHRSSQAFIQTYSPDSPALRSVLDKDWANFYQKELAERKQFLFPPFCYLLILNCRRATEASAKKTAEKCASHIKSLGLSVIIEGPAPAFHEKVRGKYQWQLIIKSKQRSQLLKVIYNLPANWSYNIDPVNLL